MAAGYEQDAIGGYLPLELGAAGGPPPHLAGAHAFQSARAAFLALLEKVRPSMVWLPWYLCDSMAEPLAQAGIAARRYALDAEFLPQQVELRRGELLLHVNQFGLLGAQQRLLAARLPAGQLVFDNSQAFYAEPLPALASLYSPRKFLGVPDGGYLVAPGLELPEPPRDSGSPGRCTALLLRHAEGAEAGYAAFGAAEATLSGQPPRRMSRLTERLLAQVDHARVRQRRRANFALLAAALAPANALHWELDGDAVPLCYPLMPPRAGLRQQLVAGRIYTPCYWPELLDGRPLPPRETQWATRLLALPVDQRYDEETLRARLLAPLRALLAT